MDEQYNERHEEWDRQAEHTACVNGAVTADTCEETQECAKRAKELYPDDFDTLRVCALAEIRSANNDPVEQCLQYEKALMRADEIVRADEEGFYTNIGDWYRSVYGRPYIRLKRAYAKALLDCGRMHDAAKQYEDIIALTHYDGYGDRYILAAVYASVGDRFGTIRLLEKYKECDDGGLLFPASVCFFKNGDVLNAKKYLLRAFDENKHYKALVKRSVNRNFREKLFEIFDACNEKGGIRAGTYELCAYDVANTMFLYDSVPAYFHWARLVAYTEGKREK